MGLPEACNPFLVPAVLPSDQLSNPRRARQGTGLNGIVADLHRSASSSLSLYGHLKGSVPENYSFEEGSWPGPEPRSCAAATHCIWHEATLGLRLSLTRYSRNSKALMKAQLKRKTFNEKETKCESERCASSMLGSSSYLPLDLTCFRKHGRHGRGICATELHDELKRRMPEALDKTSRASRLKKGSPMSRPPVFREQTDSYHLPLLFSQHRRKTVKEVSMPEPDLATALIFKPRRARFLQLLSCNQGSVSPGKRR